MFKRLEPPALDEGFDALYRVRVNQAGVFLVEQYPSEIPPPA